MNRTKDFKYFPRNFDYMKKIFNKAMEWAEKEIKDGETYDIVPVADYNYKYLIYRAIIAEREK